MKGIPKYFICDNKQTNKQQTNKQTDKQTNQHTQNLFGVAKTSRSTGLGPGLAAIKNVLTNFLWV